MVRDRRYEASTANTTAIASGRNSAAAGPLRKNMGTNTIEMEIVETNAGVAIWAAPSTMAGRISFPCSMFRLMFSMVTVASSTRIPTASANPLSVITLSVCPMAARTMIEHNTASGNAGAVAHIRDVADVDHRPVDLFDRHVVELLHDLGARVQTHVVFPAAQPRRPGRQDHVLGVDGGAHIGRGEPLCIQPRQIEIDV